MIVVLDTNVFVSGIHWSGASEKILRSWILKRFKLISSIPIIDELVRILMSFKIPMTLEDLLWWENLILEKSVIVIPKRKIDIVKEDPDDNKFIECAVAGKADYIVSQDKHLLKLRNLKA